MSVHVKIGFNNLVYILYDVFRCHRCLLTQSTVKLYYNHTTPMQVSKVLTYTRQECAQFVNSIDSFEFAVAAVVLPDTNPIGY